MIDLNSILKANDCSLFYKKVEYPSLLSDPEDIGKQKPTIITDVPRLNIDEGPSRIQQFTRDFICGDRYQLLD